MKKNRILAGLLAALMLVSAAALAACSGEDKTTPDAGTAAPSSTEPVTETAAPEETREPTEKEKRALVSDGLPEKNFDGRIYRVAGTENTLELYVIDEQDGSVFNDALYDRNEAVKSRFNVKIEMVPYASYDNVGPAIQKACRAGETDAFDVVSYHFVSNANVAIAGLYQNLTEVPYIDFEQPWWPETNREDLTVNGKCFIAFGDIIVNTARFPYCYLYNKAMAKDIGAEDLYDVVRRGDWTIDYVKQLCEVCYTDVDGNGAANSGDRFGLGQQLATSAGIYLWAFDNPILAKGEDGKPTFVMNTEKLPDIVSVLATMFNGGTPVYTALKGDWSSHRNEFQNGNVLLLPDIPASLEWLTGEVNFEIGVLPYPKWDTEQKKYLTTLEGSCESLGITILEVGEELEFVGLITEAMCAESYKQFMPVYYDILLMSRYADRPEDAEMIRLVMDGRMMDLGYVYDGWNGAGFWLEGWVQAQNTNVTSYLKKAAPAAEKYYNKVLKMFE